MSVSKYLIKGYEYILEIYLISRNERVIELSKNFLLKVLKMQINFYEANPEDMAKLHFNSIMEIFENFYSQTVYDKHSPVKVQRLLR